MSRTRGERDCVEADRLEIGDCRRRIRGERQHDQASNPDAGEPAAQRNDEALGQTCAQHLRHPATERAPDRELTLARRGAADEKP
jgi:hypothetical protein